MAEPLYKGTGIDFIRRALLDRGPNHEADFIRSLTPTERELYDKAWPHAWLPTAAAASVYEKGARALFGDRPDPVYALGYETAKQHLTGIYRAFLRITSVDFVVGRSAKLWNTYHSNGQASAASVSPKSAWLMVTHFPELPRVFRASTAGYTVAVIELTGAKDVKVVVNDVDPHAWRWELCWR